MDRPCQHHIGKWDGAAQGWVWRPRVFRETSLFEPRHLEREGFRRRCFRRAPINAERLPVQQLRPRRRSRERGENQMAQFALPTIIADAGTAPIEIARGRQPPVSYALIVQPRDPHPRIVPAHLSIGGAAGGLRVIGILEPGQIALDIVKQPAPAIDQDRPEENATRAPADQEPVEKRRPPHQQEPDESLHRRIDNPAFR